MQQQGIKIYTQDIQMNPNINLQPIQWSPKKYLPIKWPGYNSECITHTSYACYPIYFNLIILISDEEYEAHFYVTYFSLILLLHTCLHISPQTNFFNSTSQITDMCILMFPLFIRKLANKDSPLNGTYHSPKWDLLLISSWLTYTLKCKNINYSCLKR